MIGGRLKAKTLADGDLAEGDVQLVQRTEHRQRGVLALGERLQRDHDQRAVGQVEAVEQAVAG